ncbi:MAG: hypothetical protein Q8K36_04745, partial [Alphaproteobacteria bacterium]|nr:hypothetical protein [Alphaproteobacteria bacterium]
GMGTRFHGCDKKKRERQVPLPCHPRVNGDPLSKTIQCPSFPGFPLLWERQRRGCGNDKGEWCAGTTNIPPRHPRVNRDPLLERKKGVNQFFLPK